jgi:hypothetical protein
LVIAHFALTEIRRGPVPPHPRITLHVKKTEGAAMNTSLALTAAPQNARSMNSSNGSTARRSRYPPHTSSYRVVPPSAG